MTAVLDGNQIAETSAVSAAELLGEGLLPGSVVVIPDAAGGGIGWLMVEEGEGDQRRCAVISVVAGSVLAGGLISEVKIARPTASDIDAAVPEWAPSLAEMAWKAWKAEAACDAARAALTAHEARLEAIVDAAHDYANENELCSRFDYFMQENGLRTRTTEYDCEVDVTVRVVVKVTALDADVAGGCVDKDAVTSALNGMSWRDVRRSIDDFDVNDVCEA